MCRLEGQPGGAEVLLYQFCVPLAADAELEAVDVEAREPLDDRFMRRSVRKAIDKTGRR
jgi:hypothetical protein